MARSLALAAALLALAAPRPAGAVRVKDLADVVGVRDNALYGYGLVVGLAGTGDTAERIVYTQQSIAGLLARLGVRVNPQDIYARNVAAVMVTARLPSFARPGTRIDVAVSAMGDARSLAGGVLLVTPLAAGDGKVYAVAQGPLQVSGYDAGTRLAFMTKNTPTTGRVPGGATVERTVTVDLGKAPIVLALRNPDLTTASRLAAAVNQNEGAGTAHAADAAGVTVKLPDARRDDPVGFLAELEALDVQPDMRPKVVVSERTGTVVAGDGVRIRPVAVAHGSIEVRVDRQPLVSQPNAFGQGTTVTTEQDLVQARERGGGTVALPATTTVEDLAKALSLLGARPRDLISILEAMKVAGALDADLEVLE